MTRVNNHLLTQSNASDEVLTLKQCKVVLEKLPPENTGKVPRHAEPEESDSDSGDSLFITQKPVPQPVRSRRNRYKLHLEEHGADSSSSSSSSDEPLRGGRGKKNSRKKYKLPEFSFPFLSGKIQKHRDTRKLNASVHDAATVGFLRLVRELHEASLKGEDEKSTLPEVGTDEDNISPLPEEEEDGSETEDIKVVERKLFAVQLKSKSQQTWCKRSQQKNIRNASNARQEPSQEKQFQASDKEPATVNTSRVAAEENELATTHGNSVQQPERQNTKRLPEGEQDEGETLCSEQTMTESKCVAEDAPLEVHGNLDSDFSVEVSASSCAENGGKNKKNRSAEDKEQLQSRTVPESQNDEANNRRKKKNRKKGKEINTEEERREDGNSLAASQETLEYTFVKRKKKHLSGDESAQEEQCAGVSSVLALSEREEKSAKKRKKRRKTNPEEVDNSPIPIQNTNTGHFDSTQNKASEDQISETVMKRKKKKRRKRESCSENKSEQGSTQGDDSVSVQEKKGTSSFLSADAESSQSVEAPDAGAENERNVKEFNDRVRKKKKKRRKRESCSENKSEQGSAQGDDSVSVQERKRTSSFLSADAESSQSVEAPDAGAEKPSADASGLEKESAENERNVEEFQDGVREKKKKKKDKRRKALEMHDVVEKDQEQDLEEPNTYRSALSEEDTPGLKRRRKHEGNELMTPVGSLEGAVDSGLPLNHETVVVKKKKNKKKSKDETCHAIQQSPTAVTEEIVLFNVTSSTKSMNSEPEVNKNKKKKGVSIQTAEENIIPGIPSLSKSELSSSDRTKENKHLKVKRSLYNPDEDFLSDLYF